MTKRLIPIFQRAQDLHLAVVRKDVLPASRTMQAAHANYGDWQVIFAIIGESHRVRIEQGGKFFLEEMLACVDVTPDTCWHYHDFAGLDEHQYQQGQYQIQTYFSEKIPDRIKSRQCIEYHFPKLNHIEPITRIEWQLTNMKLCWWTVHTYAEDEKTICVHTESEFHF